MSLDLWLHELRREAGWENASGANAAALRLASLPGLPPVRALWSELERADAIDPTDDAGDLGDERWRVQTACRLGLVACGSRAVELLAPLLDTSPVEGRHRIAALVLAELGHAPVLQVFAGWLRARTEDDATLTLAALEGLGLLGLPEGLPLVKSVLAAPGTVNTSWLKRVAGHALGRLGALPQLEVLLDDDDWFARLGAVEGLLRLGGPTIHSALARARTDVDARVRAACPPEGRTS